LKAVTDSDSAVREWMARNSPDLDYRHRTDASAPLHPERNLVGRLQQDADPYVRAVLYENRHLSTEFRMGPLGDFGIGCFRTCAPIERLAMMRNENLNLELVKLILDLRDTSLHLEMEERTALAKACLVNANVVQNGRRSREMFPAGDDGWGNYTVSKDAAAIWELAAEWRAESGVPYMAFKYVQAEDTVKARVFRKCEKALFRQTILESCLPEDREPLKLGRADADSTARFIAYGRYMLMDRREIEETL